MKRIAPQEGSLHITPGSRNLATDSFVWAPSWTETHSTAMG
jgi:hypothetical protein